jgi:proteasome lid subunit RPN8/RPN11
MRLSSESRSTAASSDFNRVSAGSYRHEWSNNVKAQPQLIDVGQIDTRNLPERQFPGTQRFRITIVKDAHDTIWQRARESCIPGSGTTETAEIGGVLLGNVYKDAQGPYLEVAVAVAAEHVHNRGAQVVFTDMTWAHFNRVRTEQYPHLRIVGWYHTHPGTGLALSQTDKAFHQDRFPQPWAAAFVVDPLTDMDAFFLWNTGEPAVVPEYWVGQERRGRRSPGARTVVEVAAPVKVERNSNVLRASFALTAFLLFLSLMYMLGYMQKRDVQHTQAENTIRQTLEEQNGRLQQLTVLAQELERARQQARESGRPEAAKSETDTSPQR